MDSRLADTILVLWCLYITVMTIASWFGSRVSSFEDWFMSMIAWLLMIVAGFAIRGHP